jgi:hypothetical protein
MIHNPKEDFLRKLRQERYVSMTVLVILLFVSCGCVSNDSPGAPTRTDRINESINKAIDFLYLNQLETGEFNTFACKDLGMKSCFFDSSPFITPFVLYSVKDVKNAKVAGITDKGLEFLLSEQESGGVWRYWTKRNGKSADIDIDDVSMISYILKKNDKSFEDNKNLILSNKNQEKIFLTWVRQNGEKNDVDCVVNANVLLYLGEKDQQVCSYINRAVESDQPCSVYYPKRLILFYAVSRDLKENLACLEESKEKIVASTLSLSKTDGSFGDDLDTALALNTLLNCGYSGSAVDRGIDYLLEKQSVEGSWSNAPFFLGYPTYYGSQEFTTGIAIEALEKYMTNSSMVK